MENDNHTGLGKGGGARGHLSFGEIQVSVENLKLGYMVVMVLEVVVMMVIMKPWSLC